LANKLKFQSWTPGHKPKSEAIVDHREPAGTQGEPLPVDSREMFAFQRQSINEPGFSGNLPRRIAQFSPSQGIEQVAREAGTLSHPARQTFLSQVLHATFLGMAHLRSETAACRDRLAGEKLAVQPGRAWSCDLQLQGKVRSRCEREALAALGILIGASLYNRAWRGITREFKVGKPQMVRPAVDLFDDGIGRPFQLVIKTTRDQTAEDGISGLVAMEGKARDVGSWPAAVMADASS
jgi:hypothetical protein